MRVGRAALLVLLCAFAAAGPRSVAAQAARDSAVRAAPLASRDSAQRSATRAASLADRDSAHRSAERAAREWLWLLDEARYGDAWALVAPAMRSIVTYERWTTSLTSLRAVLPRVLRRELQRAEPSVPMFGGESVILSFGVDSLREIVVLVRGGQTWLVAGYGILRE